MRKLALGAAVALALSFGVSFTHAGDENNQKLSGVLIDNHCVEKFADKPEPEKAAASHGAACAVTCAKKEGGSLLLLHGKEQIKLDKHGQELAMAYLAKPDASTKVTLTGERHGDEFKVQSLAMSEPVH